MSGLEGQFQSLISQVQGEMYKLEMLMVYMIDPLRITKKTNLKY